jgi:cysteinyl-tRNA synthetase
MTTTISKAQQRLQTLQDFWQANALMTYEAIQDLRAAHARVYARIHTHTHTAASPEYHSTPIETLENTFETIGRMSRCIAEDFNTPSVVNYVEEFFLTLYREIEFNALVEAHYNKRI